MKIKSLSVILFLFLIPCVLISCFGDNDPYDPSTDDTLVAFSIDTLADGTTPLFTIDQIGNKIFNLDSIYYKADTVVDRIKIVAYTLGSGYQSDYFITGDTAFHWAEDSIDLSKTMAAYGGKPLKIKVYAPDAVHFREYEVEVRIHQVDPDTMTWKKQVASFSGGTATGKIKADTINERIFVYESHTKAYSTAMNDGSSYAEHSITTLPADSKITSLLSYNDGTNDGFHMTTGDGKIFVSNDGINWSESPLSGNIITLVGAFPEYIVGIKEINGKNIFVISNREATAWAETDKEAPSNFPLDDISYTIYKSVTGIWKMLLVGETSDQTQTTVWTTDDGKSWDMLNEISGKYRLPYMKQPSIVYYNKSFYAYGENFETFYASVNGLNWNKVEKKVLLPKEVIGRQGSYTSVIDKDNYLWIMWSKESHSDEVWKGRINKLGFKIQD